MNSKIQKNSIYLHVNMWKKLNIFVEIVFPFLWWIEILKDQHLFVIETCYNIIIIL